MNSYIWVILLTIALFMAMIVSLAAKPKFITKLSTVIAIIVGISGFVFYGYGYDYVCESKTIAIVKAIMAVSKMYVGYNALSDINAAPMFSNINVLIYFYLVHFFGFYASASAAITKLGAGVIRRLRLWLLRFGDLIIIYGCNENTLKFADELVENGHKSILFVDDNNEKSDKYVIRDDDDALEGSTDFLHSIGLGGNARKVYVYALKESTKNMKYALKLKESFKKCNIDCSDTKLILFGIEKSLGQHLLAYKDNYGFGDVVMIHQAELSARLLIQKYPPCEVMKFDEVGKAINDFDALIVGFGKTGQEVLKKLVKNGQFEGSHFHVMIASLDHEKTYGYMSHECHKMFEKYDIEFLDKDVRSKEMYDYIQNHIQTLKYIVICTGNESLNGEICEEISSYCNLHESNALILQCSKNGILHFNQESQSYEQHDLYCMDTLANEKIDEMAMLLNHAYCKGESALDDWKSCDYFSRMSSRASADYVSAIIKASGKTKEEILKDGFNLSEEMLENLGRHEHMRWCAFHYAMGFDHMSDEEYDSRAKRYLSGEKIRIGKDMKKRLHACLIDWEDLDDLSEKEYKITGKKANYKQMDINNVLMIPNLLKK